MSLRVRLILTYSALVAVIVVALGTFLYVLMQHTLETEMDRRLQIRATQVQLSLWPGTTALTPDNVMSAKLDLHPLVEPTFSGVYVQLADFDGTVIVRSENLRDAVLPVDQEGLAQVRTGSTVLLDVRYANDQPIRLLMLPIKDNRNEAPVGVLIVGQSRVPLQEILADLRLMLAGLGVSAFLFAVIAGWLVTTSGLLRLHHMAQRALAIAADRDFSRRLGDTGPDDEVGKLGRTVDHLLATVDDTLRSHREFVADTSHELRNPLLALRTNLDLLSRVTSSEDRDECISEAQQQITRLTSLTSDLLILARVEADQLIDPATVDLSSLVTSIVDERRRIAPDHTLVADVPPRVVMEVDSDRLRQALQNLLDNAIKYSPPGSTVTVRLTAESWGSELQVIDDGNGIAPGDLPFVFDRFYRGTGRLTQTGTGLGLAIVKHLVDAHGGSISVQSTAGLGSTFSIRLPGMVDSVRPLEVIKS